MATTPVKVNVTAEPDETEEQTRARAFLEPGIRHGQIALGFAAPMFDGEQALPELGDVVDQLRKTMATAETCCTSAATRMLVAQATALDAMFTEMARRALLNAYDFPQAAEKYIRLALKAQGRCAATLETLAHIQRPGSEAPRHVTVADGGQAIIADQFHHHAGVNQNGKSPDQPQTARAADPGERPPLLCQGQDAEWGPMPGAGRPGEAAMQDARREGKRRARRKPE